MSPSRLFRTTVAFFEPCTLNAKPADNALIIGCGYLGRVLAGKLLAQGVTVYGTTQSRPRAEELFALGVRPMLLSVTQRPTFASLRPALDCEALDVYYLVPPGHARDDGPSPRNVILGGIAYTLNALRTARGLRRAVLTSSTAVYGQSGNARVDADTPAAPNGERAELLLKGEDLWLNSGLPTHVVRLAGLYGPKRVIGFKAVLDGAPLVGDPKALLNLIHVEDAADLLMAMMTAPDVGRIELGCDDRPTARLAYYTALAHRLNVAPPRVLDDPAMLARMGINPRRLARSSSKACDNAVTRQRTGWQPKYPNVDRGLDAILKPYEPQINADKL